MVEIVFLLSARANVNTPTRPINMDAIKTYFPAIDILGVIPVELPTVAKADTSSKAKCSSGKLGSVNDSMSVPRKTTESEKRKIENALYSKSLGMVCLKTSTCFFPRIVAMADRKMAAKVVVLIPPPVPPGEAPININKRNINKVGVERIAKLVVLKPAVLTTTL